MKNEYKVLDLSQFKDDVTDTHLDRIYKLSRITDGQNKPAPLSHLESLVIHSNNITSLLTYNGQLKLPKGLSMLDIRSFALQDASALNLEMFPAYGFQSYRNWRVALLRRIDYDKLHNYEFDIVQGVVMLSMVHALFWYGDNVLKMIGYIPIVNVIAGIARIIISVRGKTDHPLEKANLKRHFYRGVATIFLGPLLIFIDIWQTNKANFVAQEYIKTDRRRFDGIRFLAIASFDVV